MHESSTKINIFGAFFNVFIIFPLLKLPLFFNTLNYNFYSYIFFLAEIHFCHSIFNLLHPAIHDCIRQVRIGFLLAMFNNHGIKSVLCKKELGLVNQVGMILVYIYIYIYIYLYIYLFIYTFLHISLIFRSWLYLNISSCFLFSLLIYDRATS